MTWYVCLVTYLHYGMWRVLPPTWILHLKIRFDFKSNLTSAISDLANRNIKRAMFPVITPCPMTLAPTNEAIRHENCAEKTLIGEKITVMIWEVI